MISTSSLRPVRGETRLPGPRRGMGRLGAWAAAHLRAVLLTWLAVLVLFGFFAPQGGVFVGRRWLAGFDQPVGGGPQPDPAGLRMVWAPAPCRSLSSTSAVRWPVDPAAQVGAGQGHRLATGRTSGSRPSSRLKPGVSLSRGRADRDRHRRRRCQTPTPWSAPPRHAGRPAAGAGLPGRSR